MVVSSFDSEYLMKKFQNIVSALVASGLAFAVVASPCRAAEDDRAAAIRALAETVIEKEGHVGAALAVWYQGELIFKENWGFADLDAGNPVTDDTLFFAASVIKPMVGYTTLVLAEEGKIDLDTPVQTYVPDFPVHESGASPTIRQLLLHRGGIRHYLNTGTWSESWSASFFDTHYSKANDAVAHWLDIDDEINDFLKAFPEALPADVRRDFGNTNPYQYAPGERGGYSSFGYTLVAAALEAVEKKPLSLILQERVFDPFGMKTAIQPDMRFPIPHYAKSYIYRNLRTGDIAEGKPFRARTLDFSYNAGGGNLALTISDLIEWGKQYVDGGKADQSVREMQFSSEITRSDGGRDGYGIGLIQDRAGRWIVHNIGASEAYGASITIWPEDQLVVASLMNTWPLNAREGGFYDKIAKDIGALLLDGSE